ncbi:helix-turn-helix transcriptional regulator [Shewanella algae]|uniref:helix-turn-helix transcriptional regulator n=1 Tax=Shewanella algae TaxID=38313 RepID=UPI001AACD674|nr:helix-turn-helix transcriptional regulator [Shewanella algae]
MQQIRQVRVGAEISVKDLSKVIGTDVSTVYHYETGRRTPDFNQCWKIVNALNQLGANCSFMDVFPNPVDSNTAGQTTAQMAT